MYGSLLLQKKNANTDGGEGGAAVSILPKAQCSWEQKKMGLCKTKEEVDPEISPVTNTNNPDKVGNECVEPELSAKTIHTNHKNKMTADCLHFNLRCVDCAQAP